MRAVRLGMRANLAQFLFLVAVSALVGGTVGQERAIVPLLARQTFGVRAFSTTVAFVAAFGLAKAVTNLVAGRLCDRIGRKPVMVAGWVVGVPVPVLLMWAPSWSWVVAANVVLGVHDGLTSSALVIMKIDLVGSARRGLAMGITEGSGYLGVAGAAFAAGLIAAHNGLRPDPFFVGLGCAAIGLVIATVFIRETHAHARHEEALETRSWSDLPEHVSGAALFRLVSFREPALSSCVQAGFFNNLNDAAAWGLFPILFARGGLTLGAVATLAALYPAVWGLGQFATGALSDRLGRKWIIASGMWLQAVALSLVVLGRGFGTWALAVVALGAGTAFVYPTLLAAVGDAAHPQWRASAVGIYRLWRDAGLVAGAVSCGFLADRYGLRPAIATVAAMTAASGAVVAFRMYETRHREPPARS
jgi:MFS family permease